jgi:hypothetical protein
MMRREGRQSCSSSPSTCTQEEKEDSTERVTACTQGFVLLPSACWRHNYRAANINHQCNESAEKDSSAGISHWECCNDSAEFKHSEGSVKATTLLASESNCGGVVKDETVWFNMLTGIGVVFYDHANHQLSSSSANENKHLEYLFSYCSPVVSGGMLCDEPGLG